MIKKIKFGIALFIGVLLITYFSLPYYVKKAAIYQQPDVDDYKIFENREVKNATAQPWNKAVRYGKLKMLDKWHNEFRNFETVSYVIVQNDSLLYDEYWDGYSDSTISGSFSAAKSIVSLLIGIANDEGKIGSLDDLAYKYLPDFPNLNNLDLTIRNLLTMSSGLNWDEGYSSLFSQTTESYYGNDLKKQIHNLMFVETPGRIHRYESINTVILGLILQNATGKTITDYAQEKLWKPLGAQHPALWSVDNKNGVEKSYCCFNATALDFAKIGQLVLNNGVWNGKRIISERYLKLATSPAVYLKDETNAVLTYYGYQWWIINYKGMEIPYARGILGQYIFVIPQKNAVVVRLGKKRSSFRNGNVTSDILLYLDAAFSMLK